MRYPAGKELRLRRRADIGRLFDHGRRASDGVMTILALPREDGGGPLRMAVVVSRRMGCAVRRNRVKRLCREAFRQVRPLLPGGYDVVLAPRGGRARGEALQASIRKLMARLVAPTGTKGPQ